MNIGPLHTLWIRWRPKQWPSVTTKTASTDCSCFPLHVSKKRERSAHNDWKNKYHRFFFSNLDNWFCLKIQSTSLVILQKNGHYRRSWCQKCRWLHPYCMDLTFHWPYWSPNLRKSGDCHMDGLSLAQATLKWDFRALNVHKCELCRNVHSARLVGTKSRRIQ